MRPVFRVAILAVVSLVWLWPAWMTYQVLESVHSLERLPDANNLREALNAFKLAAGLMLGSTLVWWLMSITQGAQRERDLEQLMRLDETHRHLQGDFERLSHLLRESTTTMQADFGNFTSVGTRLRGALETRLSAIETALQRQAQLQSVERAVTVSGGPDLHLHDRLTMMERTVDAALRDLGSALNASLRSVREKLDDLGQREQQAVTDFGALESRLSTSDEQWAERLRLLEMTFAEMTRKTAQESAQTTANLKLLNIRLKDLTTAVKH